MLTLAFCSSHRCAEVKSDMPARMPVDNSGFTVNVFPLPGQASRSEKCLHKLRCRQSSCALAPNQ